MEQDNNQNNISISSWKTIDIEINVNEFKNNCNNLKEENINIKDSSEENSDNVSVDWHYNQRWRDDTGTYIYPATVNRPSNVENNASVNYYNQQVLQL